MTMERHAAIADRLEAYVLDQLPELERREVEEHLQECGTCAKDVHELRAVLAGVAESVPPVAPPAALRERVLAAVSVEPQEPVKRERRVGIVQQPRRPLSAMMPLAAAAVLVLAIGVVAFRLDRSRRELAGEVSRVQTLNVELQERLKRFSGQTDLALSILTAGDMREIPLAGQDRAGGAAARAYLSPTRGILVVADRLPAPPAGRIYQVWIIGEDKKPVSAGLLGEEPGGRGMLIVTPPRPGGGGSVTVAVTDEPPGGLPAPSGSMHLVGSI